MIVKQRVKLDSASPAARNVEAERVWAPWSDRTHSSSESLNSYLHAVAEDFSKDAPRGFNPFAAKNSFGVRKGLVNVKQQALNGTWDTLRNALHVSVDGAAEHGDLTADQMHKLFTSRLQEQFEAMPKDKQNKWVSRSSSRLALADAKAEARQRLEALDDELEQAVKAAANKGAKEPHDDLYLLKEKLMDANMLYMSYSALHEVGQANQRRK